jgi:hypothetical protein
MDVGVLKKFELGTGRTVKARFVRWVLAVKQRSELNCHPFLSRTGRSVEKVSVPDAISPADGNQTIPDSILTKDISFH